MENSGISISSNKVSFGGVDIDYFVKKYQTPLLLFSEQRVLDNLKALEQSFKKSYKNTHIYYSVKTNFETQILQSLKKAGAKAEVASYLEVLMAKRAGFKGTEMVLDGPAWTEADIEKCIKDKVRVLNVDSLDMLIRVNEIAKKMKKKINIGFRINPEISISILKSFIEGYITKFGIPISEAEKAYQIASKLDHVNPMAISMHIGSMITDPSYYEKAIDKVTRLASKLKKDHQIKITEIDIGGGFGVQSLNYYSLQNVILNKIGISQYSKAASIEEFGQRIGEKFKKSLKENSLENLDLVLEPGRFIVSDSGIVLTRVVSVKKNWLFLDGGINLIPESIFFIRRGFLVPGKIGKKITKKYNIAGPTLNTADVLAADQSFPEISAGEVVIILDAGAYSLPRSNQFTMLRPDVLYITKNKKIKFLRRSEPSSDILNKLLI